VWLVVGRGNNASSVLVLPCLRIFMALGSRLGWYINDWSVLVAGPLCSVCLLSRGNSCSTLFHVAHLALLHYKNEIIGSSRQRNHQSFSCSRKLKYTPCDGWKLIMQIKVSILILCTEINYRWFFYEKEIIDGLILIILNYPNCILYLALPLESDVVTKWLELFYDFFLMFMWHLK
jgi:hypothetical protein